MATPRRARILYTTVAAIAAASLTPAATAQNALGDGRGLDNNPSAQGATNSPVRDLQSEIAFRNAIVTGNAANFQSFRGEVGYQAAGEFRGILGSDELFSFRRDSLVSGLAGLGIRGTDALQYQFALSTGGTPPDGLVGGFTVGRGGYDVGNVGSATNPAAARGEGFDSAAAPRQGIQRVGPIAEVDDRGTLLGTLRSPAAYTSNRGLAQTFLGRFDTTSEGVLGLTASELRAVRAAPLAVDPQAGRVGAAAAEEEEIERRAEAEQEQAANPQASPLDTQRNTQIEGSGADAQPRDTRRPTDAAATVHDRFLERISGEEVGDPRISPRARLELLRQRLAAPELFDPVNQSAPDGATPDADAQPSTTPTTTSPPAPGASSEAEAEVETLSRRERALRDQIRRLDQGLVEALGGADRVRELIDQDRAENSAFGQHILAGERLLSRGRYFDAEERFAHALSLRRGNVAAQIGRIHAQLGAGVYVSAGVNLRGLMVEHPEIAGAQYQEALLPRPERLIEINADLAEICNEQGASQVGLAAALLRAYIAYQTDNRAELQRAFAFIDGAEANAALSNTDARLALLLRRLWLGERPAEPVDDLLEPGG